MLMAKSGSSTVQYSLKQQQQQKNNNKSYKNLPFWGCAWHWDNVELNYTKGQLLKDNYWPSFIREPRHSQ